MLGDNLVWADAQRGDVSGGQSEDAEEFSAGTGDEEEGFGDGA
jgi:hypothetical protein